MRAREGDDDGPVRAVSGKLEEAGSVLKVHCLGQDHGVLVQEDYFVESS